MMEVDAYQVAERITELEAEVARLRHVEALRDIAEGERRGLQTQLNAERVKVVTLRDALDNMTQDMALMEETIRELSGREPGPDDYGP